MMIRVGGWRSPEERVRLAAIRARIDAYADPRDRRIARAVVDDDGVAVHWYLGDGGDPDARASDGSNLLLLAVDHDSPHALRALLEAGADPDPRHGAEVPLLCRSVWNRRSGLVRELVRFGADPNAADPVGGTTALMAAVDNHRVVGTLLAAGADPDVVDARGDTALHHAARAQHLRSVWALLEAGADPTRTDVDGNTFQVLLRAEAATDPESARAAERIVALLEREGITSTITVPLRPAPAVTRRLGIGHLVTDSGWRPAFLVDPAWFSESHEYGAAVESVQAELDRFGIAVMIRHDSFPADDPVARLPAWPEFRRRLVAAP